MVSITKKVARNAFWLFLGNAVAKLLEFGVIVYLARILTASGFGLYSFAQAILIYLLLAVDSGLSVLGIREIAKSEKQAPQVVANIFYLRVVLALIIFLVSLVTILLINVPFGLKLLLIFTVLLVFPRAITPEWAFQGIERMEFMGLAKSLQQLVFLGLVLLLVKSVQDLVTVALLQFAAYLAVSLIFLYVLLKYYISFDIGGIRPKAWFSYLADSIPLGLSAIFIQIYYNLDMIMLGLMKNPEVVGWYNAAYKLFFIFLGTTGVLAAAVFPVVCKKFEIGAESARYFLEKYLRLMFLMFFPLVILALILSPQAIELIYGKAYLPGALPFSILMLNIPVILVSGIYGGLVLLPTGKNKKFMFSVCLGAFSNVVLNLILIPPFSLVGAAVATLITEIIVLVAFAYWARKEVQIVWFKYAFKPVLAAALAILGSFWLLSRLSLSNILFWGISVLTFLLIYLMVILLIEDRRFIGDFIGEVIRART